MNEFKKLIKNKLEMIIGDDIRVDVRDVTKNNNVTKCAVCFIEKNSVASPTIYIDKFYEEYKDGRNIKDICDDIMDIYARCIKVPNLPFEPDEIYDYKKVKNYVSYKIINFEMNREMLKSVPHFKYLDLAVVFYLVINEGKIGNASVIVQNSLLEYWDIPITKLKTDAFLNTQHKYPAKITRMDDIISEFIMEDLNNYKIEGEDAINSDLVSPERIEEIVREEMGYTNMENIDMYVLTNSIKFNGATCITYPKVLEKFAKEHNSDICIIPSSVHEVILVPVDSIDRNNIDNMIKEVNSNELENIDILSDHVYIYKRALKDIVY